MNDTLLEFEAKTGLGPTFAARLIGTAYPTYAQYKSGARALPRYHAHHVQALLLLAPDVLRQLIEEHCYAGQRA